jgi:hypothetical protein
MILCGCSGVSRFEHFEIVPNENLLQTRVSDSREDLTEPTFGALSPPVYSLRHNESFYTFYPILINGRHLSAGPAFLPVIPVKLFGENAAKASKDQYVFLMRCYSEKNEPIPIPEEVTLITRRDNFTSETLAASSDDVPGDLFSCQLDSSVTNLTTFTAQIRLSDGNSLSAEYRYKKNLWVAPFFSFNEPPIKPFLEIKEKK